MKETSHTLVSTGGGHEQARRGSAPGGEQREAAGKSAGGGQKMGSAGPVWPTLRRLLCTMRPHAGILTGAALAALETTVVELAPVRETD